MIESEGLVIWASAAVLVLMTTVPFFLRMRKLESKTEEAELLALRYGLKEPVSLHPLVDPDRCIGIGNCITACPEQNVLGFMNGQAYPVSPARCIGHGLCERACPVEAIQLVFGTEKRGVDIPRIKQNFETNVPGLYIVGELGGMGLIRNAFEQGRQCIEGIAKERRKRPSDALDVLIVGCGPGGLAASLTCMHHKLSFLTIEKEDIGGTVRYYPRKKLVMTAPLKIPGVGKLRLREIRKEKLIQIWEDVVERVGLEVNTEETVRDVCGTADGCFSVTTDKGAYRTMRVVLAIGRRGVPRKLNIIGENLPKVSYALREPESFRNDRIMVVGGGDSAVEAALALAEQPGNEVKLSYRKDSFGRIKPANLGRIEEAIARNRVDVLWSTNLIEIKPDAVVYSNGNGSSRSVPNDYVFVFIGGELPTKFLESCGIEIDTKFGEP